MNKKLLLCAIVWLVCGTLLAQITWYNPLNGDEPNICGRAWNKEIGKSFVLQKIALDHAGVKNAENVHTHVVSGEEHPCYSIHLTIEGVSYEYLIDGITGEILSHGQGGH